MSKRYKNAVEFDVLIFEIPIEKKQPAYCYFDVEISVVGCDIYYCFCCSVVHNVIKKPATNGPPAK